MCCNITSHQTKNATRGVFCSDWLREQESLSLHEQYTFRIFLFNSSRNISKGFRVLTEAILIASSRELVTQKTPKGRFLLTSSASRTRTCDPVINSHLLYQLSYRGILLFRILSLNSLPIPDLRNFSLFLASTRVGKDSL